MLNDRWVLTAEGRDPLSIPEQFNDFFILFVANIVNGHAQKVIQWRYLNQASARVRDLDETATSSAATRKKQSGLNELLKGWGQPPDNEPWIITDRGKGAGLNGSVCWPVDEELSRGFEMRTSVYCLGIEPEVMEKNTPSRGERLPAHPVRSRAVENEEEDDDE